MIISTNKCSRDTIYKEITKRSNTRNIDRVALAMSSNDCDKFFGMLVNKSHGKYILLGKIDLWEGYQLLVGGKKSDKKFEDKI